MKFKKTEFQSYITEILENLPSTVFVKDAEHLRFVYINKSAENLFGFKRDELIGKNDYDFFPKEQADFFTSKDRSVLKKAEMLDIPEEPIETKNQGKKWLHTKKIPIYDENDQPAFLLGISEDITERKRTEDLLKIAREELETKFHETDSIYKTILNNTLEGVITFNEDGVIQTYNHACEEIFGYSSKEILLENVKRLIPEASQRLLKNLGDDEGGAHKIENITGHKKNGEQFPLELMFKKIMLKNSVRFCALIRDISAQVAVEKERQSYLKTLKAKNAELNDFAYIASHDLKGPLRGIHNYAHFLLEDYENKLDQPGQDMLKTLGKLTQQLEAYLDILLHYSRLGRENLSLQMTDMNNLVQKIIALYLPEIRENNIQLIIPELPETLCDPVKTSEVLNNLINNALKYNNDQKKLQIEIGHCKHKNALPEHTVFYIRDNGIGIDSEYHNTIFKIFKRLHVKQAYGGGSGSGLSISKKIIERHNGKIWVESEGKDRGCTFFFSLPQNQTAEPGKADI